MFVCLWFVGFLSRAMMKCHMSQPTSGPDGTIHAFQRVPSPLWCEKRLKSAETEPDQRWNVHEKSVPCMCSINLYHVCWCSIAKLVMFVSTPSCPGDLLYRPLNIKSTSMTISTGTCEVNDVYHDLMTRCRRIFAVWFGQRLTSKVKAIHILYYLWYCTIVLHV